MCFYLYMCVKQLQTCICMCQTAAESFLNLQTWIEVRYGGSLRAHYKTARFYF